MLRSTKELIGDKLAAVDGTIGKVKDFLFDDAQWTVRWMVADTGDWLSKRKVLISPITLGEPDWNSRLLPVRLTKSEIESSPGIGVDEPVSMEYETRWFDHHDSPYYWSGPDVWGGGVVPGSLFARQDNARELQTTPEAGTQVLRSTREVMGYWSGPGVSVGGIVPEEVFPRQEKPEKLQTTPETRSHVLRSTKEVMGYHIQAKDDEIGHVEGFIVDDESWTLRYVIVDTRNWLPGRKVLIALDWVEVIHWADQMVTVNLSRDKVKASPEYLPDTPVNREYEERLHDYYGRPVYWNNP